MTSEVATKTALYPLDIAGRTVRMTKADWQAVQSKLSEILESDEAAEYSKLDDQQREQMARAVHSAIGLDVFRDVLKSLARMYQEFDLHGRDSEELVTAVFDDCIRAARNPIG